MKLLKQIYKCSQCSFDTFHKRGLKTHINRKHAKENKTCDLCEEQFDSVHQMKLHRKTHSFTESSIWSKFKCEECDFESKIIETMEVHIGKCCYDYFECGLCDFRPGSLDDLEMHLATCEVYECGNYLLRVKHLSDIKEHI